MRKLFLVLAVILFTATLALVACTDSATTKTEPGSPTPKDSASTPEERVKRGEYLVNSVGCDDCHSPKKMGEHGPEVIPELRLSGYPAYRALLKPDSNAVKKGWILFGPDFTSYVGPWGMSFSANLTSDQTGIGSWSEENFMRAIRKGKFKGLEGGRDLLPPMPWFVYKNMTDEDIKSIFAYLKTVPPVENVVPAPKQISDIK